jgi:actin-related protein
MYSEFECEPTQHAVLMTEPPLNPRVNRQRMAELCFETLDVPALYFALPAVLAVYASGRGCALALDCGDGVTHVVPIVEGYTTPEAIRRVDFGGHDVTSALIASLTTQGHSLSSSAQFQTAREIKESVCCLDINPLEPAEHQPVSYSLPDGSSIAVQALSRVQPAQLLFGSNPHISFQGIHHLVYDCLQACDIHTRSLLASNIVVSGGTTLLPQFDKRLQHVRTYSLR